MPRRVVIACGLAAAALACLAVALLPTAAGAARIGWVLEDPAGDAPDPRLDLRKAVMAVDEGTGDLMASVTLAAAPTHDRIDSVVFTLGRWSVRRDATCDFTHDISVMTPAPEEQDVYPWPYALIYQLSSDDAIGHIPTYTHDTTVELSGVEADPTVREAIRAGAFNCADVETVEAGSFTTRDSIALHPLVAGPQPGCEIARKRVKRGRALRVRCAHAAGDVTLRIYRPGRSGRFETVKTRFADGGRLAVATGRLSGPRRVSLWQGDTVIGRFDVTIGR